MKYAYVIREGKWYTDGYFVSVCLTKKSADRFCRKDGFKYSKKDDLYIRNEDSMYRSLHELPIFEEKEK